MIPLASARASTAVSKPRASGDDPGNKGTFKKYNGVNPARAGMIPVPRWRPRI